jgi:transcriptional regulator of acetoin/glycerol metabolism
MPKISIRQQAAERGVTVGELIVTELNTAPSAQQAAARLGVKYRTLWGWMKRYGIQQSVVWQQINGGQS